MRGKRVRIAILLLRCCHDREGAAMFAGRMGYDFGDMMTM
jgi:hypothetical protein